LAHWRLPVGQPPQNLRLPPATEMYPVEQQVRRQAQVASTEKDVGSLYSGSARKCRRAARDYAVRSYLHRPKGSRVRSARLSRRRRKGAIKASLPNTARFARLTCPFCLRLEV